MFHNRISNPFNQSTPSDSAAGNFSNPFYKACSICLIVSTPPHSQFCVSLGPDLCRRCWRLSFFVLNRSNAVHRDLGRPKPRILWFGSFINSPLFTPKVFHLFLQMFSDELARVVCSQAGLSCYLDYQSTLFSIIYWNSRILWIWTHTCLSLFYFVCLILTFKYFDEMEVLCLTYDYRIIEISISIFEMIWKDLMVLKK